MVMVAKSGGGKHLIWKNGWPELGVVENGYGGCVVVNGGHVEHDMVVKSIKNVISCSIIFDDIFEI